jgi:hypothetical protein
MKNLKLGDKGELVLALQAKLNCAPKGASLIKIDGDFGPRTEDAVRRFQKSNGLIPDGIVGPNTWDAICPPIHDPVFNEPETRLEWVTVPAMKFGQGYDTFHLREDIAKDYLKVHGIVDELGGMITSSGSKRRLNAHVNATRSATSLHYLGRALDLFVGSAMTDVDRDPLIVEPDTSAPGFWTVWARVDSGGVERQVDAWHHRSQSVKKVTARVINLTDLFDEHGFKRISSRKSYSVKNYGASEWWHFQHEGGLVANQARFGDELLKIYTLKDVEGTGPWKFSTGLWHRDWW